MSIQCHTKANEVATPYPWGVNSVPTQCNLRSILFQSKPKRPPITHNFGTNPLTILYQSIANPMSIKCQSITNLIPILFQSIANPMSIHRHLCTNALPVICQSSDIAVQIHCHCQNIASLSQRHHVLLHSELCQKSDYSAKNIILYDFYIPEFFKTSSKTSRSIFFLTNRM